MHGTKALILAAALLFSPAAVAQTATGIENQARTLLWFDISDDLAVSLIPAGWVSAPIPAGPSAGADLVLILIESHLSADAEGQPGTPPTNLFAVLSMPMRNEASGQAGNLILGGYVNDPAGAPGYYGNYLPGSIALTRSVNVGDTAEPRLTEAWIVTGRDGASLEV